MMNSVNRIGIVLFGVWLAFQALASNASTVDLTKLPLGDNLLSTTAKVGYLWPCMTGGGGGGAFTDGPWFNNDGTTYNLTTKATVNGSVSWSNQYSSYISGSSRVFVTNDLPNHTTGTYPIASADDAYLYDRNPNSIKTQQIQFSLTASPTTDTSPHCTPGAVGILLTGAVLFNAVDAEDRDAVAHEVQDSCQGHPQSSGVYHYHNVSTCSDDSALNTQHSSLIGYAVDGFGIYGHRGENGVEVNSADLDECHGHTHTITWDGASVNMYHYHATWDFPYTIGCLRGTYDQSVVMAISNGTSATTSTPIPTSIKTNTPIPTSVKTNTPAPTKIGTPAPTSIKTNTPTPTKTSTPTPTIVYTRSPTPAPISSHNEIQRVEGSVRKNNFGAMVAYIGDINGDDFGDYAIGIPLRNVIVNGTVLKGAGAVDIISGKDKQILYTLTGDHAGDHFGSAISGGQDVNGDGINDLAVGAYLANNIQGVKRAGLVKVFSGADASIIYTLWGSNANDNFGYSVALIGDADGDKKSDVAVGIYGADKYSGGSILLKNAGSVEIFIGTAGTLYRTVWGGAANAGAGYSLGYTGDVNNDGFSDVIFGSPFTDYFSMKDSGSAFVYSPHDDKTLVYLNGTATGSGFGVSVSGAGDVNHDGLNDVIVGANKNDVPIYDANHIQKGTVKDSGSAFVYSSTTRNVLFQLNGSGAKDYFGSSVSSVGDINNDGYDDVAVAAYAADVAILNSASLLKDAGSVSVYSGITGQKLFSNDGLASGDYFGASLSHGDVNNDGVDDVIVGATQDDVVIDNVIIKDAGSVSVISAQQ